MDKHDTDRLIHLVAEIITDYLKGEESNENDQSCSSSKVG